LIVTLYAAGRVASVRESEASGQLAILLTLPLTKQRWLTITIAIGLAANFTISLLIGLGAMLGTALTGPMLDPVDAIRTGLNLVPIAILFTGLGILLFGVYPQLTGPAVYATMLTSFLLVLIDAFLDIPGWIISLSPFTYLALVPAENANLLAAAVFVLLGAAGGTIGLIAFQRRDLMMN
jgi:ABC-2 type transport system permease protein